jgi:hypothetical protein
MAFVFIKRLSSIYAPAFAINFWYRLQLPSDPMYLFLLSLGLCLGVTGIIPYVMYTKFNSEVRRSEAGDHLF